MKRIELLKETFELLKSELEQELASKENLIKELREWDAKTKHLANSITEEFTGHRPNDSGHTIDALLILQLKLRKEREQQEAA